MKKGQLIVVEGLDGSGKDTAVDLLKIDFPEIAYTREPGGTEVAEEIRQIFIGNKNRAEKLDTLAELLLIHAARRQHIINFIQPKLERGVSVVCNRFDPSTYAYQLFAKDKTNVYAELFHLLHKTTVGISEPNLYILLDVSPEEAKRRVQIRTSEGGETSRFDEKPVEYYRKLRAGYLDYLKRFCNKKHVIIDANKSKEDVYRALANEIRQIMAKVA